MCAARVLGCAAQAEYVVDKLSDAAHSGSPPEPEEFADKLKERAAAARADAMAQHATAGQRTTQTLLSSLPARMAQLKGKDAAPKLAF